jgi:hypothetical protein
MTRSAKTLLLVCVLVLVPASASYSAVPQDGTARAGLGSDCSRIMDANNHVKVAQQVLANATRNGIATTAMLQSL